MVENQSNIIASVFSNAIDWVWIDLDDTLIDFHANSDAALRRVYDIMHLDRWFSCSQQWLDSYHEANDNLWARYNIGEIDQPYLRMERFRKPLTDAGMNEEEAVKMSKELDPLYLDILARGKKLIPGAKELLDALRSKGYKTGILSNGFNDVQQKKLLHAGIADYIDKVVLSDDIGVNKPDTRLYKHAMKSVGDTDPTHHLMIGDNPDTDIKGALDAGWKAILFNRNQRSNMSSQSSTAYPVVDSLHYILPSIPQKNLK